MVDVRNLYAQNKPASAGSEDFLKLDDGDSVRVRFLDLPVEFTTEFQDGKTAVRWAWPIYNFDSEKMQIFEAGKMIYNALNDLIQDEEYGDPAGYDVKIARTGKSATDTRYTVTPTRENKEVPKDADPIDVLKVKSSSQYATNVHRLGEEASADEPITDIVLEDIEDKPIDLSEIPFN